MTARETLLLIRGGIRDTNDPAWAALRELDQLLADMSAYIKNNHDDELWFELEKRAAQAGYGEK